MGRRVLPTNIKLIKGTAQPCRINENEPKPREVPFEEIKVPAGFEGVAYQTWIKYSKLLADLKVLTEADLHNLEAFCRYWAMFKQQEELVREEGSVVEGMAGPKKNPRVTAMNDAAKKVQEFGSMLGLDPASRPKLTTPKDKKKTSFSDL